MAFTRMTGNVDNISALSDRPNDTDGMSAAALKAAFDAAGNALKTYVNTVLIPELEASGAENIGIEPITALGSADNVQAALEALFDEIRESQAGVVLDGSIGTAKLEDLAVTAAKLSELAVTTEKIYGLAVTTAKLANGAVTTDKIADANVTGAKLAPAAVGNSHLGSKVVKQANIDDNAVGTNQIAANAVTFAKTTGIQKKHTAVSDVSIAAISAGGTVNVTVSEVTANNTVIVSPAPESWAKWRDCGVRCSGQAAGRLTFTAESATGTTLKANIVILD